MKTCPFCGASMADDAVFCATCGKNVNEAQAQPEMAQPQQPQQQYTQPQQPQYGQPQYGQPQYGQPQYQAPVKMGNDGLAIAAKILMIIGTVAIGWMIIPLAWCIPMTISAWKKLDNGEPIDTGFKVCILLFVNLIAGILLLCRDDYQYMNRQY